MKPSARDVPWSLPIIAIALGVTPHSSVSGQGVERFWDEIDGGTFDDPSNWTPFGVPALEDTAVFDLAALYTVVFPADQLTDRVLVRGGLVTFAISRATYVLDNQLPSTPSVAVGETDTDTASLTVAAGGLHGEFVDVGQNAGAFGMLTVTGPTSHLICDVQLRVAQQGAGLLEISGGALVSSFTASIASGSGAFGNAVVTDPGTIWICDSTFSVGKGGAGSLMVADGATVITGDAIIAQQLSSFGDVTITGPGSSWLIAGSLDVGFKGFGTLVIADGATVTNGIFATIGTFPRGFGQGAVGEVIVSGSDSVWTVNGDLFVGLNGSGRWTLSAGGRVVVAGDLMSTSFLALPETTIELAGGDDYETPAISVTGMADGFDPRIVLIDGFVPQAGDSFFIATAGLSLGAFNFSLPRLPLPLTWKVVQDANAVSLRVGPLLADLNDDFVVNVLDLIIMLLAFGDCPDPPEECPSDLTGDGTVDRFDLIILLDNFGQGA